MLTVRQPTWPTTSQTRTITKPIARAKVRCAQEQPGCNTGQFHTRDSEHKSMACKNSLTALICDTGATADGATADTGAVSCCSDSRGGGGKGDASRTGAGSANGLAPRRSAVVDELSTCEARNTSRLASGAAAEINTGGATLTGLMGDGETGNRTPPASGAATRWSALLWWQLPHRFLSSPLRNTSRFRRWNASHAHSVHDPSGTGSIQQREWASFASRQAVQTLERTETGPLVEEGVFEFFVTLRPAAHQRARLSTLL